MPTHELGGCGDDQELEEENFPIEVDGMEDFEVDQIGEPEENRYYENEEENKEESTMKKVTNHLWNPTDFQTH